MKASIIFHKYMYMYVILMNVNIQIMNSKIDLQSNAKVNV